MECMGRPYENFKAEATNFVTMAKEDENYADDFLSSNPIPKYRGTRRKYSCPTLTSEFLNSILPTYLVI
jgi:hypothetical protein